MKQLICLFVLFSLLVPCVSANPTVDQYLHMKNLEYNFGMLELMATMEPSEAADFQAWRSSEEASAMVAAKAELKAALTKNGVSSAQQMALVKYVIQAMKYNALKTRLSTKSDAEKAGALKLFSASPAKATYVALAQKVEQGFCIDARIQLWLENKMLESFNAYLKTKHGAMAKSYSFGEFSSTKAFKYEDGDLEYVAFMAYVAETHNVVNSAEVEGLFTNADLLSFIKAGVKELK